MADDKSIQLRASLKALFSDSWLRQAARDAGFVKRERKIRCVPFFWTLVLGFGVDSQRSISALRRAYQRTAGTRLVPSAFYDRFNSALVRFLKLSVSRVSTEVSSDEHDAARRAVTRMLAKYRDVEELVQIGAYAKGSDPESDRAIELFPEAEALLRQGADDAGPFADALETLRSIAARAA